LEAQKNLATGFNHYAHHLKTLRFWEKKERWLKRDLKNPYARESPTQSEGKITGLMSPSQSAWN